jgi:hypothetical protein
MEIVFQGVASAKEKLADMVSARFVLERAWKSFFKEWRAPSKGFPTWSTRR